MEVIYKKKIFILYLVFTSVPEKLEMSDTRTLLFVKKFCKLLALRENSLPTTASYKNI